MDFGKILEQWDISTGKGSVQRKPSKADLKKDRKLMAEFIEKYGVIDKDASYKKELSHADRRLQLKMMKPQAKIDLHGKTVREAEFMLNAFFDTAVRKNLKKVLIIHGKGKHSKDGSGCVMRDFVKTFLDKHPNAGASGFNKNDEGGSGSTWVMIKQAGNASSKFDK